jgi:hypothetical protein
MDLQSAYSEDCEASRIFSTLSKTFGTSSLDAGVALCGALPILATWTTSVFVSGGQIEDSVRYMLRLPPILKANTMKGVGQIATVVLDRYVGIII